jgi:hypothetical protein
MRRARRRDSAWRTDAQYLKSKRIEGDFVVDEGSEHYDILQEVVIDAASKPFSERG